tara:strand:- start:5885 stop:6178 length:294 start_codon:yes stop_codon:yes gene_type:complete
MENTINASIIDHIEQLCCLSIKEEKKDAFSAQLNRVLDYMTVLNAVEEDPSPEFEWPLQKDAIMRDDVATHFSHPLVNQNAPDHQDGCFVVPKILHD